MKPTVLIAPSGFKESLAPDEVAACIARGLRRAEPTLHIDSLPLVDGGEGTARILAELTGGQLISSRVTGPVGEPVEAGLALLGGQWSGTAVVEMAQAAGLRLVPPDRRNPLRTTTRGVGELIRTALDLGARRVIIGCGDSGTNDAGAGAVQALGVRLLDRDGCELGLGGGELLRLDRIELNRRDPRLAQTELFAACNWSVTLANVTRSFSRQKGADDQQTQLLEVALERFAQIVQRDLGVDLRSMPGSGASGGLGAGLHALLGATLRPRYEVLFDYFNLDEKLRGADVVITAEGQLDAQTCPGKVPAEIARRAAQFGVPVFVLAGSIGPGARDSLCAGVSAYHSILQTPCTLPEAIAQTANLLEDAAEQLWRCIRVGMQSGSRRTQSGSQRSTRACVSSISSPPTQAHGDGPQHQPGFASAR